MKKKAMVVRVALSALMVLQCLQAQAQAQAPSARTGGPLAAIEPTAEGERALLAKMGAEPGASAVYLDEQGQVLSFESFLERTRTPGFRGMSTSKGAGKLTFKLVSATDLEQMRAREKAALKVQPGQALAAFQVPGLDGKPYDNAALKGRYAVVSFFFEACQPCIAEVPSLNAYRRKHPELNLLAATFDDAVKAQRFQAKHQLEWPIAHSSLPLNQAVGVAAYPSFLVLDPQGRVLGYRTLGKEPSAEEAAGRAEHAALAAWVKELIDADRAAVAKGG